MRPPRGRPTADSTTTGALEDLHSAIRLPSQVEPNQAPRLKAFAIGLLADMRATRGDEAGDLGPRACVLIGTTEVMDGGEGVYVWDGTSRAADDGSSVVEVAGVQTGRWRLALGQVGADVQAFISSGSNTWTKPDRARLVHVTCVGSGGSGGSGRRGAAGTVRTGGGGGGGAGISTGTFAASLLGATETATVGNNIAGGLAVATNDTDGDDGDDGEPTSFGQWLSADPGEAGNGGGTGAASGGPGGAGNFGTGSNGAASSATGLSGSQAGFPSGMAAGGGGSGGGITSGDATSVGGTGGFGARWRGTIPPGGTAGSGGTAGGTGGAVATGEGAGGGGGGGGASNGAGRDGGIGGAYGGGGGGGGASVNGTASGNGGLGRHGICVVVTVF